MCRRALPLPAGQPGGVPLVVPVSLEEVCALSSIRVYIPKDLRTQEARALGVKVRALRLLHPLCRLRLLCLLWPLQRTPLACAALRVAAPPLVFPPALGPPSPENPPQTHTPLPRRSLFVCFYSLL